MAKGQEYKTTKPARKGDKLPTPISKGKLIADKPSFVFEINRFVHQIESLSKALFPTTKTMEEVFKNNISDLERFIKDNKIFSDSKDGTKTYHIKAPVLHKFKGHIKAMASSAQAVKHIPRIFMCSLVHQYDAYLGRLLRTAFFLRPETITPSGKSITYKELASFSSIDDAKKSIIEKEVETVLRDSHIDHFEWMEKRFDIPLRKDLPSWKTFVEITERRNLFVHCDGVVSSHYLDVCKKEGVVFEKPVKLGEELDVSLDYFKSSFNCIFEIGFKLGHVLWRKLLPKDIEKADTSFQNSGYELLSEEQYDLAIILLEFYLYTFKHYYSDEYRRINLINLAIAYRFSGRTKESKQLIEKDDWSACGNHFRLAVAVLQDRYKDAIQLMKQIGADGKVTRENYSQWPLFKEFRRNKMFLKTYHSLFGEEFVLSEDTQMAKKE